MLFVDLLLKDFDFLLEGPHGGKVRGAVGELGVVFARGLGGIVEDLGGGDHLVLGGVIPLIHLFIIMNRKTQSARRRSSAYRILPKTFEDYQK